MFRKQTSFLWKRTLIAGIGCLAIFLWSNARVNAEEAIDEDRPTPLTVDEVINAMDRAFEKQPPPVEKAKPVNPFWRDQKLDVNLRTYFKSMEKYDNSMNEAWAVGGAVRYKSGYFLDHFAVGAAFYTSQPLYAPSDRDGTLLLKPQQREYSVLGQAYGEIKIVPDNFLRFYRQEYDTPYMNKNDNRMTPNTFEGYSFQGAYGGENGQLGLRYGLGYITKIKQRNSDEFVWMSRAAGANADRGVAVAGLLFSLKSFSIGAIDYYSDDIINIFYAEAKNVFKPTKDLGMLIAAQFTDQESVGDNLLKGYGFSTNQFGVKGEISYHSAILTLGYTIDAEGADLQNPWSSYPGYTSVQVQDFNRAGENATIGKLSYDFSSLGLTGFSAYFLWVHGWNRINPTTKSTVKQEDEYDYDLQWRPQIEVMKGIWFRVRYAYIDQRDHGNNESDLRVIVNYDFSLL